MLVPEVAILVKKKGGIFKTPGASSAQIYRQWTQNIGATNRRCDTKY
jgi:hypothetical protein